jgi:hypothetical protein
MLSLLRLEHSRPTLRAGVCARVEKGSEMLGSISGGAPSGLFVAFRGMHTNDQPTHTDLQTGGGGAGS